MKVCLNMDPTTLDPRKNADVYTCALHFLLYEGLTQLLPSGEGVPALAESIDVSSDGKSYLFHLRDSYWSDGVPITAKDFEYSWKRTLTPSFGAPCAYLFYPIKNAEKANLGLLPIEEVGVKALDPKTLQVELEHPTPYFLSLITFCNFFPIPHHIEASTPSWERADQMPVVSGPFRLAKWQRNRELLLEKNPAYWDAHNVHLDQVLLTIISDERTAFEMFENGELDVIGTMTAQLSLEDLARSKKEKKLRIAPLAGTLFCTFNVERFPFNNVHIRRALSAAIDRDSLTKSISQLSETAATRCIPPVLDQLRDRPLLSPFDPEVSKELLEKGLKEIGLDRQELSNHLILTYMSENLHRRVALTLQHQWKKVLGLDLKLQELDRKTLMSHHMAKNYALGLNHYIAQYHDSNNILERFKYKKTPKNLPGFEHPDYIRFLDAANAESEPQKRCALLDAAEELLLSEAAIAPLFHYNQGMLVNPAFTNVETSSLGDLILKNAVMQ